MIFIIVCLTEKIQLSDIFRVMKSGKRSNIFRYIIGGYGLLYLAMLISEAFSSGSSVEDSFGGRAIVITVIFAFVVFLIGTIYLWFNERIAGILICFWHFIVWVFSLLLWPEAGMVLVLILPMLFPGVFLIRNYIIRTNNKYTEVNERWRLTLKIFMINYAAIYSLIVFANMVPKLTGWSLPTRVDDLVVWDYSSSLGLILIALFILFVIGYSLVKHSELISGIIFILWYVLIWILSIYYPEFANSGPSTIFGFVILIHGIFYIILHTRSRKIKNPI
jgi:hypothetical protein